jgi:hypothetical protein
MKRKILRLLPTLFLSHSSFSQPFQDSLRVSPNPFIKHTDIFFSFSSHDTVSLKIYQNVGQMVGIINLFADSVMSAGAYSDSLFMDSYPDGTYYALLFLGHRKTIVKPIQKGNVSGLREPEISGLYIHCFPNPAKDQLSITFKGSSTSGKYRIYSALGVVVQEGLIQSNHSVIPLNNHTQGVYVIEIENGGQRSISKFIKAE